MLISPDNEKTAYLCQKIAVINENNEQQTDVYSFNTETKETETFFFNSKGEVRVENGEIVLQKSFKPTWRVVFKDTGKEVVFKDGKVSLI